VQTFVLREYLSQLLKRPPRKQGTQLCIDRHLHQPVPAHDAVNIHPRTAADHRKDAPNRHIFKHPQEIALVLIYIVPVPRIHDINHVHRHSPAVNGIIRQVLARPDIHPAINLPRVSTDHLPSHPVSHHRRQPRLPCCGRAGDNQDIMHRIVHQKLKIAIMRSRYCNFT